MCDFEEIFFLEMIKDKDTNFFKKKKIFKLSIPSFKFQISKKKKKKSFQRITRINQSFLAKNEKIQIKKEQRNIPHHKRQWDNKALII